MKLLPTLLVSLVTVALGVLAVLQQVRGNLDFIFGSPPLEAGKRLYQFSPDQVGRIQITNSDGTSAEVVKADNTWMLTSPWKDFADARTVKSLIDFSAKLQIEDVIDRDDVDDMADYGLKKDRIEVRLFDTAGQPLCHFRLGRYTTWRSFDPELKPQDPTKKPPSFPTLIVHPAEEGLREHLYVCADFANPALRTIPIRDLFVNGLRTFRDHRLFYLAPSLASRITLKEGNSEIILSRGSSGKDTPWRLEKPFQLASNEKAMTQLINGLSAIQAAAVVDRSALTLPPPDPGNIAFSVSIDYFKEGSEPITASFYPPENDTAKVVSVVVSSGGKQRDAILRVPHGTGSQLAALPRDVNSLRSRTMTAMQVRDVKSIDLRDPAGRTVSLNLEQDPHERAARWHATVSRENSPKDVPVVFKGPANTKQVFEFFEALFKDEVLSFTNDAATSPETYGLHQPVRRITITPRKGKPVDYVIGDRIALKYYARRTPNGRAVEISEEAWIAARKGEPHPQLNAVASPTTDLDTPPTGLEFFGLDRPEVVELEDTTLHLGKVNSRLFYANRLDAKGQPSPHVVEIAPEQLAKMPLAAYLWRGERLWNINRFEINGLKIKKRGQPMLELSYKFYEPKPWSATQGARDVTALLNTHKAEKLLKKLTDIEVQSWLGPIADNAADNLIDPSLTITIVIENMSDDGKSVGRVIRELKLAEVVRGPANRFFFGKSTSLPDYFLIDDATHQRLSVDLLEE
ncbi:MAG: DUF4340 domain-containing protein [Akkermansiaceae bacterium]|jgi:hypothetical protein